MAATRIIFRVRDYDLAATLDSGQVFRWQRQDESWVGVVGKNFARLTQTDGGILAETSTGIDDLNWLRDFLQIGTDLDAVLKTFPDDEPMRAAVAACPGLRLLRQDPWECLASFILSSTKQIVQIRQIVSLLCERFGEPVERSAVATVAAFDEIAKPAGTTPLQFTFPTPQRIAACYRSRTARLQNGFSRAEPAGRRAGNRRGPV